MQATVDQWQIAHRRRFEPQQDKLRHGGEPDCERNTRPDRCAMFRPSPIPRCAAT